MKKNNYVYMIIMIFLTTAILMEKPIVTSMLGTEVYFKGVVETDRIDTIDELYVEYINLEEIDSSKWDDGINQIYTRLKSEYEEYNKDNEDVVPFDEKYRFNSENTPVYIELSTDKQGIAKILKISDVKPKGLYIEGNLNSFINKKANIRIKHLECYQNKNNLIDLNKNTGDVLIRTKIYKGYILDYNR